MTYVARQTCDNLCLRACLLSCVLIIGFRTNICIIMAARKRRARRAAELPNNCRAVHHPCICDGLASPVRSHALVALNLG